MIARLRGRIEAISADSALIDVGGVGYLAFCSTTTLASLALGREGTLLILTHVREDHIHLYGFATADERAWFDLLLSVQGVGPKMALAILSTLTPQDMANALTMEDKRPFQSVSGVGPKVAARLVTELKEKSPTPTAFAGARPSATRLGTPTVTGTAAVLLDLVSALVNLGYDETSARRAAQTAIQDGDEASDLRALIPVALKALQP